MTEGAKIKINVPPAAIPALYDLLYKEVQLERSRIALWLRALDTEPLPAGEKSLLGGLMCELGVMTALADLIESGEYFDDRPWIEAIDRRR